ncbi:MAG: ribonuclease P protein component [bacterium]
MLPKKFRLTLNNDIKMVRENGKPFLTKLFNFKIKNNNLKQSRFCIIISGKVDKRAVIKNRIKRQISEIVRLNMDNIKSGYDISILVKNNLMDKDAKKIACDYKEMEKNILFAFDKMNLLKS